MNIVSNNCAGAFLYTKMGSEFNNPFMWTLIFAKDMISLIHRAEHNSTEPNFRNVSAVFMSSNTATSNRYIEYNNDPLIPGLLVDDVFTVYFPHYRYRYDAVVPIHQTINVYYRKNYEYAATKYMQRLKRWYTNTEQVSWFIVAYDRHGWSRQHIDELMSFKYFHRLLLVTTEAVESDQSNVCVICDKNINNTKLFDPKYVVDAYFPIIQSFFNISDNPE